MRRRFGTSLIAAVLMASLAWAAPSSAPVADAAMRGDRDAVRTLLQEGADVNASQGDGMSALHWAAERGDATLVEMLLYAGANPRAGTRIGQYTPLHVAARAGHAAVVAALVDAGASVDAVTTNSGATPLHLAAAAGSVETVRLLAEKGADVNALESEWGQTPLIFAAAQNRTEAVKALLALGASPNIAARHRDLAKHTALDRAAFRLQLQIYQDFRRQQGASRELTPEQFRAGALAARALYASGQLPAAKQEGGDVGGGEGGAGSVGAMGGLTALLHAARQGYVESALALIDGGADVNQVSAGDGTSPLLMAVINGQFDMAMALVERGADPNIVSTVNGVSPLWAAVNVQWQPRTRFPQPQEKELQVASYLDVMKALLEAGADPNARVSMHPWYMVYTACSDAEKCGFPDHSGSTALWRAAYGVDLPAMKLLVEHGADPNIPTIALARRRGAAAPSPSDDPSGLPPILPGGPGVFAIHAAAGSGYGDGAGNAHRHAPEGWMAVVRYIVEELGVDVNLRDYNGYTAIHHAAARGDNEMILYLVSKGADVTVVSRFGQTVADMANGPAQRISPYPETIALLEKLGSKNSHNCMSC